MDGLYVSGYDGTTTAGFNITSSEMGYLYYAELGNIGKYDIYGNLNGCNSSSSPWCLTNTGDFQNLQPNNYCSATEYAADTNDAWYFYTDRGGQNTCNKNDGSHYFVALAVRPGDVAVVPEPVSSILFVVGGASLGIRRFWKKRGTA